MKGEIQFEFFEEPDPLEMTSFFESHFSGLLPKRHGRDARLPHGKRAGKTSIETWKKQLTLSENGRIH
jgi:hypothetical protein